MAHEHVVAGLAAALRVSALTADAVALEARRAADESRGDHDVEAPTEHERRTNTTKVASLTERRLRATDLPPDTRPMPDLTKYDVLLPSRRRTPG